MKKIFLCGHTGSTNRGCEAIVRSTVKILNECGVKDIRLFSYAMGDDWKGKFDFHKEEGVEVVYLPRTPEISTSQIKTDL